MQVLKTLVLVLILPITFGLITLDQVFQVLAFTDESQNPVYAFSVLGYFLQGLPVIVAFGLFYVGHCLVITKD
jgi:hypothetical protein